MGRDYVLVQLSVRGKGPFDFMVDTGLTAELITPHLRKVGAPASHPVMLHRCIVDGKGWSSGD